MFYCDITLSSAHNLCKQIGPRSGPTWGKMVELRSCTTCEGWGNERGVRGLNIFGMAFFIFNVNSLTIYSVVTKLAGLYFAKIFRDLVWLIMTLYVFSRLAWGFNCQFAALCGLIVLITTHEQEEYM